MWLRVRLHLVTLHRVEVVPMVSGLTQTLPLGSIPWPLILQGTWQEGQAEAAAPLPGQRCDRLREGKQCGPVCPVSEAPTDANHML